MGFYKETDNVAILRERIAELARIREDYSTQLGSILYEATKDNESLVWGREALYAGIESCDNERAAILERIDALESGAEDAKIEKSEIEEAAVANADIEVTSPSEEAAPVMIPAPAETDAPVLEPLDAEPVLSLEPVNESAALETIDGNLVEELGDEGIPVPPLETTTELSLDETVIKPIIHVPPTDEPALAQEASDSPVIQVPEDAASLDYLDEDVPPTCPTCGSEVGINDKFCMNCGTPIKVITELVDTSAPTPGTCPNCGGDVDPSFKFCMICGYKLK